MKTSVGCLFFLCVLIGACSKNDSSSDLNHIATYEKLLQGKWRVTSSSYNFYNVNNDIIWHEDDLDKNLKISIIGNRMEQSIDGQGATIPFAIDSSDGVSKLIFDEGDNVYDTAFIIKLSKSTLVWSMYNSPDTYQVNGNSYDSDHSIVTENFVRE